MGAVVETLFKLKKERKRRRDEDARRSKFVTKVCLVSNDSRFSPDFYDAWVG